MQIGIFGSSFNPVHIGHLIISEQARYRLNLDKVLLVPTANPYHKQVDLLDFSHRYNMAMLISEDNEHFDISNVEENIEGNSYSFDVINELKKIYTNDDFYFIIGSDSFNKIHTWYRYEDLLKMVNLVVFKRPGYDIDGKMFDKINSIYKNLIYYDDLQLEISSTYIRKSIKNGYCPKYLLHESTIKYIKEHRLWQ
nr:nicotinate (nicotinamide) nucleotide adenylyltransferase [Helcococcus sueciensis]